MSNLPLFDSLSGLVQLAKSMGLELPVEKDISALARPVSIGRFTAPNRLAIHPMEGCDSTPDGSPGELTFRRYDRFCSGGAGVVWFEATAVVAAGRANPRQLWLHKGNVKAFAELVRVSREAARRAEKHRGQARISQTARNSSQSPPVFILQLTHSGRYSKPTGRRAPVIGRHCPILDPTVGVSADHPLISDDELDQLQRAFVEAAELAAEAGFDGVDMKACHRYLFNELLGAHSRPGRYGGSYENRTRMLRETLAKVHAAVGGRIAVASRMNVYDGMPYPSGWGVGEETPGQDAQETHGQDAHATRGRDARDTFVPPRPDLDEPIRLVGELIAAGLSCLSVTAGNPYFRPHFNRPTDRVDTTAGPPPEHPLVGVARLVELTRAIQQAYPALPVIGAGYTWLRQLAPHVAAGAIARGWTTLAGLGRGALAYPDFAADILHKGQMFPDKLCVLCSKCSQIMRDGGQAGCVVRDVAIYGPIYRHGRAAAK